MKHKCFLPSAHSRDGSKSSFIKNFAIAKGPGAEVTDSKFCRALAGLADLCWALFTYC